MRRVAVLLLANAAIALAATYDLTCPGCFGLSAIHDINNSGTFVGSYGFGVQQGLLCSSGVCTTINFPGAAQTEAHGINDSGLIAGTYTGGNFLYDGTNFTTLTVSGPVQGINNSGQLVGFFGNHGFLDDGGVITSIDVPGAVQTQAMGINNSGQIVGDYQDGAGVNHGFLLSGGVLTILDAPGATSAPNVFGRAGTDA